MYRRDCEKLGIRREFVGHFGRDSGFEECGDYVCAFGVIDPKWEVSLRGKLRLFQEVGNQMFEPSQVVRDRWAGRDLIGNISGLGLESAVTEKRAMEKSHRRRLLEEESTAYAL